MNSFFTYLLTGNLIITICFIYYFLFLRNEKKFGFIRFYFIISIIISVLMPLQPLKISLPENTRTDVQSVREKVNTADNITKNTNTLNTIPVTYTTSNYSFIKILKFIYLTVFGFLSALLIVRIILLVKLYHKSKKVKFGNITIVTGKSVKNTFSVFNIIFTNLPDLTHTNNKSIFIHEHTHIIQLHTFDLVLAGFFTAFFWFNPFVWLFYRAMCQNHEFLADKGVIQSGIAKTDYLKQMYSIVSEENIYPMASNFNQYKLKKRFVMITQNQSKPIAKYKLWLSLPVIAILFLFTACITKSEQSVVATISPANMNVLYIGLENPLNISVQGIDNSELKVIADNGEVINNNGKFSVKLKKGNKTTIKIYHNEKEIGTQNFIVKRVPDPYITVCGRKAEGEIAKSCITTSGEVGVKMDIDYSLDYRLKSFDIIARNKNGDRILKSDNDKFSAEQLQYISSLPDNTGLEITNAIIVFAGGTQRIICSPEFIVN